MQVRISNNSRRLKFVTDHNEPISSYPIEMEPVLQPTLSKPQTLNEPKTSPCAKHYISPMRYNTESSELLGKNWIAISLALENTVSSSNLGCLSQEL